MTKGTRVVISKQDEIDLRPKTIIDTSARVRCSLPVTKTGIPCGREWLNEDRLRAHQEQDKHVEDQRTS